MVTAGVESDVGTRPCPHGVRLNSLIERVASSLARAHVLVILSGAGVSKESGVPTFRDAQTGLWAKYDPQELATPQAFRRDPELVWRWYSFRRELVAGVQPNAGHLALAELEQFIPHVVVLTQNVDGLHQAAGSSDVVELHGSIRRNRCGADCQGSPTLIDLGALPDRSRDASPPRCPRCGAHVRPDVIWFGEPLPEAAVERASTVSAKCDVMLVVGTSGIVYPAAALPSIARHDGGAVIEVNPEPSGITPIANTFLRGSSGRILPGLVEALKAASY